MSYQRDTFYSKSSKLYYGTEKQVCGTTSIYRSKGWESAFGNILIPSNSNKHCRWDISVNKLSGNTTESIIIGLSTVRHKFDKGFHRNTYDVNYAYYASHALKYYKYSGTPYGNKINGLYSYSVELNCKEGTIKYYANNVCKGVAINNLVKSNNISYCIAVSISDDLKASIANFTMYNTYQAPVKYIYI